MNIKIANDFKMQQNTKTISSFSSHLLYHSLFIARLKKIPKKLKLKQCQTNSISSEVSKNIKDKI